MNENINKLFTLCKKLQLLADSITDERKWINASKGHYVAMSFGKGYKTYSAILLLCRNGYGQDALVLARTLFELTVNTLYIFSDSTDGRIDRYLAYQWVIRKKAIDYYLKDAQLTKMLVDKFKEKGKGETIKKVQERAKEVQEQYKYTNNRWSKYDLSIMAEEVGLEGVYKTLYKVQNDLVHSTVGSIDDYLLFENQELTVKIGSNNKRVEQCLMHSLHMFSLLTGQFSLYFSLGKDAELQELSKELEKILIESSN